MVEGNGCMVWLPLTADVFCYLVAGSTSGHHYHFMKDVRFVVTPQSFNNIANLIPKFLCDHVIVSSVVKSYILVCYQ